MEHFFDRLWDIHAWLRIKFVYRAIAYLLVAIVIGADALGWFVFWRVTGELDARHVVLTLPEVVLFIAFVLVFTLFTVAMVRVFVNMIRKDLHYRR